MSQGVKIIILFFLGSLAVILIVYFLYFSTKAPGQAPNTSVNTAVGELPLESEKNIVKGGDVPSSVSKQGQITSISKDTIAPQEREGAEISRMVFSFVERFGSYSHESRFQNLQDLEVFMTQNMKIWVQDFISKNKDNTSSAKAFKKITTKSLVVKELDMDPEIGLASIVITTQRREFDNATATMPYYQDIYVELKKINNEWKVDSATWK